MNRGFRGWRGCTNTIRVHPRHPRLISLLGLSAPLRLCVSIFCSLFFGLVSDSAEIDAVKVALLVDGMASKGSGYDATELHAFGADGLAAVLDYFLPETAVVKPPTDPGPPPEEVRRLIVLLDADDSRVRDRATEDLSAKARTQRKLIEEAAASDSLEVRMRAERVLSSWESRPAARLGAYLSGFWAYLEKIHDAERLEILAKRTVKAIEPEMPEGDRLHLLRLCIAGVAHGRDETSCDLLRPLVKHADPKVAALVTETVGAYKIERTFVPQLMIDALQDERSTVVEASLRFILGSDDPKRRESLRSALRQLLEKGEEPLKFQACLPLMRDYNDADAWLYVLEQANGGDSNRLRTAINWIADTKNSGQPPAAKLTENLRFLAASDNAETRRAAALALAAFAGEDTVRWLFVLFGDQESSVSRQAEASLLAQPDHHLVRRLLNESTTTTSFSESRLRPLLTKLKQQ